MAGWLEDELMEGISSLIHVWYLIGSLLYACPSVYMEREVLTR